MEYRKFSVLLSDSIMILVLLIITLLIDYYLKNPGVIGFFIGLFTGQVCYEIVKQVRK